MIICRAQHLKVLLRIILQAGFKGKANLIDPTRLHYWRIHNDKFGYELFDYLVGEKLAQKSDGQWFLVEAHTAMIMMELPCRGHRGQNGIQRCNRLV